jgi:hypothetical protein
MHKSRLLEHSNGCFLVQTFLIGLVDHLTALENNNVQNSIDALAGACLVMIGLT